jgi:hypothetical protein
MGIYAWVKDQHDKTEAGDGPIFKEFVYKYIPYQHATQEEQMRDQVPHEENIAGIGEVECFLQHYQRQLVSYTIIPVAIGEQGIVVVEYVIITNQPYFPLCGIIPCNPVVLIDTKAGYHCKREDKDNGEVLL